MLLVTIGGRAVGLCGRHGGGWILSIGVCHGRLMTSADAVPHWREYLSKSTRAEMHTHSNSQSLGVHRSSGFVETG
jgi:hypothetical protein